jgi:hypothetical protein
MSQEEDELKEENQRIMKFIQEQQARFTLDMQQMRDVQAQAEEKWERRWGRTEEGIRSLLAIAEIHDREIKTLAETQSANAEVMAEGSAATVKAITAMAEAIAANAEAVAANAEALAAHAEAQARTDRQMAETDERLNALINVVEQLISEKRSNGDSQGETSQ